MKNDTTDRHADALSESAEERKQGYGEGNVGSIATSLDGESGTSEQEAETDAAEEVNHYPLNNSGGVNVKEGP